MPRATKAPRIAKQPFPAPQTPAPLPEPPPPLETAPYPPPCRVNGRLLAAPTRHAILPHAPAHQCPTPGASPPSAVRRLHGASLRGGIVTSAEAELLGRWLLAFAAWSQTRALLGADPHERHQATGTYKDTPKATPEKVCAQELYKESTEQIP